MNDRTRRTKGKPHVMPECAIAFRRATGLDLAPKTGSNGNTVCIFIHSTLGGCDKCRAFTRRLDKTLAQMAAPHPKQRDAPIQDGNVPPIVVLLALFARHMPRSPNRPILPPAEPQSVTRAKEFVLAHLTDSLGMSEVARQVCVSPHHFCEVFKRITGMTFTEYVARLRVERAKVLLLLDPSKRVTEVAFDSGFQSVPYFNRVFKKHAGISPTQYRSTQRA